MQGRRLEDSGTKVEEQKKPGKLLAIFWPFVMRLAARFPLRDQMTLITNALG